MERTFLEKSRDQRLRGLVNDRKVSAVDRGWIKQEMNEVAAGKKGKSNFARSFPYDERWQRKRLS